MRHPYCIEVHRKAALVVDANAAELVGCTLVATALRAGAALTHGAYLVPG